MTSNEVAYWQLQEQKRTNVANEGIREGTLLETIRANKVDEVERQRHNQAQEAINSREVTGKNVAQIMNASANLLTVPVKAVSAATGFYR